MQVKEILAIKGAVLYTISPERPLVEAIAIMTEQDVGSLVCFAQGKMAGMLTFREVLNAVHAHGGEWQDVAVAKVMVAKPFCASPEMEMDELRRVMVEHHQRYLPVMEEDTLMGVVSFHDVAKAVLEEQSFENKMLKAYIRNWPEEKTD
ncbi:CBS domain-containing protein [Rugosibacter aromaticivorans]|uniref:CBS domain-containing protein n=1 Tax=Rugosibacter aromaticivorans TaxID=1565605 RepID=A0A0C5J8J2_9PROT|nr:CBS domain-containing protein [Rugosibacter aromaticivorans]AJP48048.1 CBS domain-containing protein [Rugosibacter aromaticivorans]TBR16295.1 MAG: CBS domain-containing protein [Rugosibacter sp.]